MNLLNRALIDATNAHEGQTRKYTGEPYIVHPKAVLKILVDVGVTDENILCGALLHDTVEDTNMTLYMIADRFNYEISNYVFYSSSLSQLTNVNVQNRSIRKKIDRKHYLNGNMGSWLIKVGDALDNSKSILSQRPAFAKTFLKEKHDLIVEISQKIDMKEKYSINLVNLCARWISLYLGKF